MSDIFSNIGGAFLDELGDHESTSFLQSANQHDPRCQTNNLPLDRCLQCGPLSHLYNGRLSPSTCDHNSDRHSIGSYPNAMSYAQVLASPQPTIHVSHPEPTHTRVLSAFPPLENGACAAPVKPSVDFTVPGSTYAQVAQRANQIAAQRQETTHTSLYASRTQAQTDLTQSVVPDQGRAQHGTANQIWPQRAHANQTAVPQRRGPVQRRPSRAYHTPFTIDLLQDLSQLSTGAAVLSIPAETNQDPRSVSAFVQKTQRGAHRQPFSSSTGPSIPSSPVPGTLSAASSSRSRRTGEAMRDPSLPYRCPVQGCRMTFYDSEGLTRHFNRTRGHGNVEDHRHHRCMEPGCDAKPFVHPKDLRRHARIHMVEEERERIDCPYLDCPKSFTRRDNFNRHVRDQHRIDSAFASSTSTSRRGSFMAPRPDQIF